MEGGRPLIDSMVRIRRAVRFRRREFQRQGMGTDWGCLCCCYSGLGPW